MRHSGSLRNDGDGVLTVASIGPRLLFQKPNFLFFTFDLCILSSSADLISLIGLLIPHSS